MILRRFIAAVALLCAITSAHAQTGSPKTSAQLNTEINTLFPDQVTGQITPFDLRQVTLDQVASSVLGTVTLTGPVTGSGINTIATIIGSGMVHSSNLNADVFSTANAWLGVQTFTGGATGLPSPANPTDAATKSYVDATATGLNVLPTSALATATVLPNTPTYSNGTLGVGATLTSSANSTLTVDGTVATINTVVLVKNQASAFQNGVYTVTTAGSGSAAWVLTRATYFDQAAEMKAGSYTFITAGSTNTNSSWTLGAAVTTVGTDPLNWNLFSVTGSGVTSIGSGMFTGAVTNLQVTSSCNVFTSSLSGCVPSGSGTTDISQLSGSSNAWVTPTAVVLQTRTAAAALNLTGVNTVQTLGYASAGDGGGAAFKNVGSAPFIDSFIATGTIVGGSLYTNGTYYGVQLTGGTGVGAYAVVTVSGNAVTAVSVAGSPGNAYSVGDVLTASNSQLGGTGSGFTFTIATVTSPLASFSDTAGTHWQYIPDQAAWPNIRQFGAMMNWNGTDGSATDDFNSIQASVRYATYRTSTSFDSGGSWGSKVLVPRGSSLMCGTGSTSFILPNDVTLIGAGAAGGSTLKMCDSFNASTHFMEICDPNWHFACFNARLEDIEIFATRTVTASNKIAMIHSNAGQDFGGLSHVYIYAGERMCTWFEKGYGGASTMNFEHVSCTAAGSNTMMQFGNTNASGLNLGTTIIEMNNIVLGGPSSGTLQTAPGIVLLGGQYGITGAHCEDIPVCIEVDMVNIGNQDTVRIHNVNAGSGIGGTACTGVIQLDPTNTPGNAIIGQIPSGSCTNTVTNAQSGGTSRSSQVILDVIFNP